MLISKQMLQTITIILLYSIAWVLYTGNAGFVGDEWRMISIAYWLDFPELITEYAIVSGRPLQLFHHLMVFEFIAYSDHLTNMLNLLIHSASVFCFGLAIWQTNRDDTALPLIIMPLAFLVPALSSTIYGLQFSGGYVGTLFFWLSVILLQRGIITSRLPYWIFSTLALTASFYGYENAIALSPVAGLLALLVFLRHKPVNSTTIIRYGAATIVTLASAYVLFLLPRYLFDYSFHVGGRSGLTVERVWQFLITLPRYLPIPSEIQLVSGVGIVVSVMLAGFFFYLLWKIKPVEHKETSYSSVITVSGLFLAGVLTMLLGSLPYVIVGYAPAINLGSGGRIFSSAIYGLILIIALIISSLLKTRLRLLTMLVFACLIGGWSAYFWGLGVQIKTVENTRQTIYRNWLDAAPDVTPNTSLLLVDFQTYDGQFPIIVGTTGINNLVEILYDDSTINAHFVYTGIDLEDAPRELILEVSAQGVRARGLGSSNRIPGANIVILQLDGTDVRLLDELTPQDEELIAIWLDDLDSVRTTHNRIIQDNGENQERLQRLGILR